MEISGRIFFATGSETEAFSSLEQAILSQTVKDIKKRNTIFALCNTVGTSAMAGGILLASLPQIMQDTLDILQFIHSNSLLGLSACGTCSCNSLLFKKY